MQPVYEEIAQAFPDAPALVDGFVADVSAEDFALDRIQSIIASVPDFDLFPRDASGGVRSSMPRTDLALGPGFGDWLESTKTSVLVRNLQRYDPRSRELVGQFRESAAAALGLRVRDIREAGAGLFLSSPEAVVHYHNDREHGFLMHLCGSKTVRVLPRQSTPLQELLRACLGKREGLFAGFRDDFEREAKVFDLQPGTTLYIPRLAPHWVKNGPEISISLNLFFFTPGALVHERIYRMADKLRLAAAALGPARS